MSLLNRKSSTEEGLIYTAYFVFWMKNVYEGRDFAILVSNEQKGLNYLIHVKDKDSNGILRTIQLPQTDTF